MADKQTLIVTGLSGMLGDRFAQLYGHKFDFDNLDLSEGIDITDEKVVTAAVEKSAGDVILHLAAFTDVDAAAEQDGDESGSVYQVNVEGTRNIVNIAKKYNKFLVHVSTDFVFDGTKRKPYTEEDKPNPIEWYGKTKAMAEEIVTSELEHYSILRPSFPFRSTYEPKLDLVRKIIKGLKEDNLPPMFSDNFITPTFVDDLCKVFFMFTLKRPRGIWHATGSNFMSSYDLAKKVKEAYNLPGEVKESSVEEYNKTAKRPYHKYLKMSNAKLQEELGNPMLPFESALMIMGTQFES